MAEKIFTVVVSFYDEAEGINLNSTYARKTNEDALALKSAIVEKFKKEHRAEIKKESLEIRDDDKQFYARDYYGEVDFYVNIVVVNLEMPTDDVITELESDGFFD